MEMPQFCKLFYYNDFATYRIVSAWKICFSPSTKGVCELTMPYLSITVRVTGPCWRYNNMHYFTALDSDHKRWAFFSTLETETSKSPEPQLVTERLSTETRYACTPLCPALACLVSKHSTCLPLCSGLQHRIKHHHGSTSVIPVSLYNRGLSLQGLCLTMNAFLVTP